jgi:hypothetical protein
MMKAHTKKFFETKAPQGLLRLRFACEFDDFASLMILGYAWLGGFEIFEQKQWASKCGQSRQDVDYICVRDPITTFHTLWLHLLRCLFCIELGRQTVRGHAR